MEYGLEREDSKGSPYPRFKSGDRSNRDNYKRELRLFFLYFRLISPTTCGIIYRFLLAFCCLIHVQTLSSPNEWRKQIYYFQPYLFNFVIEGFYVFESKNNTTISIGGKSMGNSRLPKQEGILFYRMIDRAGDIVGG
ncbi:hypothetical protein F4813DRAFT_270797 [Daldinia decipiens]|uniref:uncharacterized protein n=1 Tax=Daldinia decipiens TaxID=326647 RepID=UPI0020C2EC9C|nr:uncharacterized protein F4813DRAFT_270797 [Daldinia decipiens]KAI1660974.1 hypothetical protein F4813DRAFT_270797 [Daldinia decipiens]